MVAYERFGVFRFGVFDQRADAGPGGEDIATADVEAGVEVVTDFGEDPVDFFFACYRVRGYVGWGVGCTGDGIALPW